MTVAPPWLLSTTTLGACPLLIKYPVTVPSMLSKLTTKSLWVVLTSAKLETILMGDCNCPEHGGATFPQSPGP